MHKNLCSNPKVPALRTRLVLRFPWSAEPRGLRPGRTPISAGSTRRTTRSPTRRAGEYSSSGSGAVSSGSGAVSSGSWAVSTAVLGQGQGQ